MNAREFAALTGCAILDAYKWADAMQAAMEEFHIETPYDMAAFLAQCTHETLKFTRLRENMNYTPEALMLTFNGTQQRFTAAEASLYGRTDKHPANQQMIANIAYAGRYGNGDRDSGDGWRFRGGGCLHLTFRDNYACVGKAIGVDLIENPDAIQRPDVAARSAARYWSVNGLSKLAQMDDIDHVSRAINGGKNGLVERRQLYASIKKGMLA